MSRCVAKLRLLELVSVLSGHFDISVCGESREISLLLAKTSAENQLLPETDPHPFVTGSVGKRGEGGEGGGMLANVRLKFQPSKCQSGPLAFLSALC